MEEWHKEVEEIHVTAIKKSGILPWSLEDSRFLTLALCGETGELANLVKKHWRGDFPLASRLDDIRDELADIAVYTHLLCTAYRIDVNEAVAGKLPEIRAKFLQEPQPNPGQIEAEEK